MNNWPRHSFCLNIRGTSSSHVRKKEPNSYIGRKKQYITVNKESNKRSKGSSAMSKKDNKKIFKTQASIKSDR